MATSTPPSVMIFMADYGHDPTETAVPYNAFSKAGFKVSFATETGNVPECDKLMLTGWTQKVLGATRYAVDLCDAMTKSPEFQKPLSWTDPSFPATLDSYNLLYLPGGHEKGVRQLYDCKIARKLAGNFFQAARKPSRKVVSGICHGVLLLAEATIEEGEHAGKSCLHDACTTALPGKMEGLAYHATKLILGDYYKTYGAGTENVETSVRNKLTDPAKQWRVSLGTAPFVVEDETYNYLSARFPPDSETLANKTISLVNSVKDL